MATLILADSILDTLRYRTHEYITSGAPALGRDAARVADNLRDATSWTDGSVGDDAFVGVDTFTTKSVDMIVLDRGHNLRGKTIKFQTSDDAEAWDTVDTYEIPSSAEGIPSATNGLLTVEGVWCKTLAAPVEARAFRILSEGAENGPNFSPIITSLYMGLQYRLPNGECLELNGVPSYDRKIVYRDSVTSKSGLITNRNPLVYKTAQLKLSLTPEDYPDFDARVIELVLYGLPLWFVHDDSVADQARHLRLYHLPDPESNYRPFSNSYYPEIDLDLQELAPRTLLFTT